MMSLDSLLQTRVSAASKYEQVAADAPASVTILTADDIRRAGFRNLQEVLESIRGFYVTNDRNYPYLGARGFSRPSDYNNRMLVLVDGHMLNEQVWGSAPVGSDLPLNLDAVERIEVVRGPGSAVYGTNAMFGVINLVMKSAARLNGVSAMLRGGNNGARELGFTAGGRNARGVSGAVSGLVAHSAGGRLYFAEYDTPQTNNGRVEALDWERGGSALGTFAWHDLTLRLGYRSRGKGIPTGSYSVPFGDSRARTLDESLWGELAAAREIATRYHASARLYGDRYYYRGIYPQDADPSAWSDNAEDRVVGGEAILVIDRSSRDRWTLGSEYRRSFRSRYETIASDGSRELQSAPHNVAALFVQNDLQLTRALSLISGVRVDKRTRTDATFAPRAALVFMPRAGTTVKLLYGEAFRSPSPAERDFTSIYYNPNPDLRPERIRTFEVELQRRISSAALLEFTLYDNSIYDLIDQVAHASGGIQFVNRAATRAHGGELELRVQPGGWLSGTTTVALQDARDDGTRARLTNSPTSIASASLTASAGEQLYGTVLWRYESRRLTIGSAPTPAFSRADVNVRYRATARSLPTWIQNSDVSLRITNAFDRAYYVPGGLEHVQSAIRQDGRNFLLGVSRGF